MSDWTWSDELDRYTYGIIRDNYDVTYENNINVGEAIVRITGKNWCSGSICYTLKIKTKEVFSSD